MTKRCVALNPDGTLAMMFQRKKDAMKYFGTHHTTITRALEKKAVFKDYRMMYEEDYIKAVAKGRTKKFAFGSGIQKIHKSRVLTEQEKLNKISVKQHRMSFFKRRIEARMENIRHEHKEWVRDLIDSWLERGDSAVRPWMLAEYYHNKKDIEIALISCLSINVKNSILREIEKLRNELGDSPWEYFRQRLFANKKDTMLSQILNEFWKECFSFGNYRSIGDMVKNVAERDGITYEDVILRTLRGTSFRRTEFVSIIILTMSNVPGIGFGVWNIPRKDIVIRCDVRLKRFLRIWVPDCDKYGRDEESIMLTGLDHADFYLFYLAYSVLKRINRRQCSDYEEFYNRVYNETRRPIIHSEIVKKLPKIAF